MHWDKLNTYIILKIEKPVETIKPTIIYWYSCHIFISTSQVYKITPSKIINLTYTDRKYKLDGSINKWKH